MSFDGGKDVGALPQSEDVPPPAAAARPKSLLSKVQAALHLAWDKTAYVLCFEWLNLSRWPSLALLLTIVVGLAVVVGATAVPVKNGVTLGVEFGGGYSITYNCVEKPGGPPVTDESVQAQANAMFEIAAKRGQPNTQVTVLKPSKIVVIIPGVTNKAQIGPIMDAYEALPLGLETRSAVSMSGEMGQDDLRRTITAAAVALIIVWAGLTLRYWAAGLLGLYLTVVFLWLQLIFYNASDYALSDAAIVAVVLNIGLAADAHVITFERIREDLHSLGHVTVIDEPRAEGLAALNRAMRISLVTVIEANITTILAMLVLFLAGVGGTVEFAFTVMISVCASILINVLLARCLLRLGWNAGVIKTGGFFGDKGPAYDEERKERWQKACKCVPWFKPRRQVNLDFIRWWWIAALVTAAIVVAGAVLLGVKGLNWGVDYTAGTSVNMIIPPPYDYSCDDVISYAERKSNVTVSKCRMAAQGHVNLRFKEAVDPHKLQIVVYRITNVLGGPIVYNEYTIDNSLALYQSRRAITAMIVSAVVTCAFFLLRFGPIFASSGFLGLASAGVFAICCFAMGQWEVNLPFVSAVLTVFSYAINDCVVVFDRIRFELAEATAAARLTPTLLRRTVNRALSLVTIRSLLTLAVVLVCSICLVGMGPEGLHSFALALTFGLLNATYTTILICAPFYFWVRALFLRFQARRLDRSGSPELLKQQSAKSAASWGSGGSAALKVQVQDSM